MQTRIMYIELKSGYNDNGPAWIGRAGFSKSGRTVYFNGKAFKKGGQGYYSNYFDLETGDEYWISGVKRNERNRHWAGSGKIMIDSECVDEYLKIVGGTSLDKTIFEVASIQPPAALDKFHRIENESDLGGFDYQIVDKPLRGLSEIELRTLVEYYTGWLKDNRTMPYCRRRLQEVENELERRKKG